MNAVQTVRSYADRRELRRDRRFVSPALQLEIEGRQLTSINWSLGGFLVRGDLTLAIGETVTGKLHMAGSDGFTFVAKLVRKDARSDGFGFQFEELVPLALAASNRRGYR
jgi:hypothetical protein